MKSIIFFTFITCSAIGAFESCGIGKKETGSVIYIEIDDIEPELEKCFSEQLYNKWSSMEEMRPHKKSEKYMGAKPEYKHIFKSFDEFDVGKDKAGTVKINVKVDPAGMDTTNTFFQLQKFSLEKEGIWNETMNLGHFRVQDRPNDTKNPGKIDNEEICDQMVRFCIKASYKP